MGDSGGSGKILLGSACTKMEGLIGFVDGLDMEYLRRKSSKTTIVLQYMLNGVFSFGDM